LAEGELRRLLFLNGWYLVYRSFRAEQRDFTAFRRWIMRTAAGPAARSKARRHAG
jgi:LysR family glycine cleavage system transcriptional activator